MTPKSRRIRIPKLKPHAVRFEVSEREWLDDLASQTGLPVGALIRMAVAYSLPKLMSGEIQLADFISKKGAPGKKVAA
jgi:hypothetical protein